MSELKADKTYIFGEECLAYKKSEADKVIAELNRKIKLYEDLGSCKKGCPALRHNQRRVESEIYKVELKEKEIRHQKYKRCLAMAMWCESEGNRLEAIAPIFDNDKECWEYNSDYWYKWQKHWMELADKFKESK